MAYKVFTNGSVLNASEVNDNLMNQAVITFSNSTARGSAITTPVEGMLTYLEDTNAYEFWNGTAWTALSELATWTSFTPTRNNITVGNGVEVARYQKIGKTTNVFYKLTFGSTTSFSGLPSITTPTTPGQSSFYAGTMLMQDTGSGAYLGQVLVIGSLAYAQAFQSSGTYVNSVNVSATIPFTFGNTDIFTMQFSYEEA